MKLYLTNDEQQQLEELGPQFPYAELLWNISMPDGGTNNFEVHLADALEWKDVVDNGNRGFLPKAQGTLKRKLQTFYERIG